MLSLIFIVVAIIEVCARDYSNHTLVRVACSRELDSTDFWEDFDVWSERVVPPDRIVKDIFVSREQFDRLTNSQFKITAILIDDISKQISEEKLRLENSRLDLSNKDWTYIDPDDYFLDFRRTEEVNAFLNSLLQTYPNLLQRSVLGNTTEGRTVYVYRLSPTATIKTGIYLQAQVHAREWLTIPTLLYIVNSLLQDYTNGVPEIVQLLSQIEVHFVAGVNLDGIEYSWTTDRLWRKNRRNNGDGSFGVDLNRNYGPPLTFCLIGASTNPTSNTYCGPSPFSEIENVNVRDYVFDHPNIRSTVDIHTYGPLIIWSWQTRRDRVLEPRYSELLQIGARMEDAISGVHGLNYESIQGGQITPTSGSLMDFMLNERGLYTFTLEGRGPSFVAPPSDIIPSGEEQYEGIKALMEYLTLPSLTF